MDASLPLNAQTILLGVCYAALGLLTFLIVLSPIFCWRAINALRRELKEANLQQRRDRIILINLVGAIMKQLKEEHLKEEQLKEEKKDNAELPPSIMEQLP